MACAFSEVRGVCVQILPIFWRMEQPAPACVQAVPTLLRVQHPSSLGLVRSKLLHV